MFWDAKRRTRISFAILAALSVAVFVQLKNPTSSVSRGDFPAFYAAAYLVSHGRGAELYSETAQAQIENQFWPELNGTYLSYSYPPFVATILSPLAHFSPPVAKIIFSLCMLFCLWRAVDKSLRAFAYCVTFAPILMSITAGQNTALSMLLFATSSALYVKNTRRSDFFCGLALGLWLFKPHFVFVAALMLLSSGRPRIFLGIFVVACLYYVLGAFVLGWEWPIVWFHAAKHFAVLDLIANGHQMVSLFPVMELFLSPNIGVMAGGFLSIVLIFWTAKKRRFQLIAPGVVLAAGHVLFYDLGLSLIGCLQSFRISSDIRFLIAIAFSTFVFALSMIRTALPISPLVIAAIIFYVVAQRTRVF